MGLFSFFSFSFNIYLFILCIFIFGCIRSLLQHAGWDVLVAAHGFFTAAHGLLSSCGAWVFFPSCGMWTL